jgi:hypothetical protein
MNALELLESLPSSTETPAMLPRFKPRAMQQWVRHSADALLELLLIEAEACGDYSIYQRSPLGDLLLKRIEEQHA